MLNKFIFYCFQIREGTVTMEGTLNPDPGFDPMYFSVAFGNRSSKTKLGNISF
jgi:hypothetical protein